MSKWKTVRLGDVCEILNGFAFKSDKYVDSGIRVIRITNVQKGYIEDNSPAFYPLEEKENLKDYELYENDLLISLTGNVGRVAQLSKEMLPAALNQRVGCIRIKDNSILISYLFTYLNSDKFESDCIFSARGIAQKNMSTEWLKNYFIPLPPIDQQKKIALELEKCSKIISKHQKQLQNFDTLIKSRFIEMFGDPVTNSKGWEVSELQELVTEDCTISYGIVQTGELQKSGVRVFRPIDIVNRKPKLEELIITSQEISNKYKKTVLHGRELLITVRANIGDTCVIGEEFKGCNVGRGIVPIRTNENIISLDFLKQQFDTTEMNRLVKSLAKGITLIQLNMEDLRKIKLIVPPISLQNQFASFVQQIDKSKFAVQKSLEKAETLYKSLMQEYFG